MIVRLFKKNRLQKINQFVEPDEIFLDSKNLQNFDQQQFAGRIETPLKKSTVFLIGGFFTLILFVFFLPPIITLQPYLTKLIQPFFTFRLVFLS